MSLPRIGDDRLPTAAKDNDALIAVRGHENEFSKGSMNNPKA